MNSWARLLALAVVTNGLVFLSVLALVLFGGDVLRAFSLALFIGVIVGTYSSIAIAAPILLIGTPPGETGDARRGDDVRATRRAAITAGAASN